jgi:hypothetical protein
LAPPGIFQSRRTKAKFLEFHIGHRTKLSRPTSRFFPTSWIIQPIFCEVCCQLHTHRKNVPRHINSVSVFASVAAIEFCRLLGITTSHRQRRKQKSFCFFTIVSYFGTTSGHSFKHSIKINKSETKKHVCLIDQFPNW